MFSQAFLSDKSPEEQKSEAGDQTRLLINHRLPLIRGESIKAFSDESEDGGQTRRDQIPEVRNDFTI